MKPTEVVQGQLDAYNNQDIEAFLTWYTDDVEVYNFPDSLVYKGKERMRENYSKSWRENPRQRANITTRIQVGKTVFDQEHVMGRDDGVELNVVAIFTVTGDKISRIHFVRE